MNRDNENMQHLVFLVNFDRFFWEPPSGKIADKCLRLSPRPIMLAGYFLDMFERVTFVMPRMPSKEFMDYLAELFGQNAWARISFVVPENAENEPLSLSARLSEDASTLELLKSAGPLHVTGLINTRDVLDVAHKLGATTWPGINPEDFPLTRNLNNKYWFKNLCGRGPNRIFTPPGKFFCDPNEIAQELLHRLRAGHETMLRTTEAAGGLGNLRVVPNMEGLPDEINTASLLRFLCNKLGERNLANGVLIEQALDIVRSFAVEVDITDEGHELVAVVDRNVVNSCESAGSIFPAFEDWNVSEAVRLTLGKVMQELHRLGYRGRADCDWGLERIGDSYRLVAFEINARWTATSTMLALANIFFGKKNGHELYGTSCDYLRVPRSCTLAMVLDFLRGKEMLGSDPHNQVAITVPPGGGAVSYVVLANDIGNRRRMDNAVRGWAASLLLQEEQAQTRGQQVIMA